MNGLDIAGRAVSRVAYATGRDFAFAAMTGYRATSSQDHSGRWLVCLEAFSNVVGDGASRNEARAKALAALVQWINILIEHGWLVSAPIDAVEGEDVLVIDSALAWRVRIHNEACARPPEATPTLGTTH